MATIKILTDAGVCLCPCYSYPVGLHMFFASEPLASTFFVYASCGCSCMTIHMCMLV